MFKKLVLAFITIMYAVFGSSEDKNRDFTVYADAHNDTITAAFNSGTGMFENNLHVDISRLSEYTAPVIVFAVWTPDNASMGSFSYADAAVDFFLRELAENSDYITLALSKDDILRNISMGKISAVLALEGANCLEGDLSRIDYFHEKGVRIIAPVWNGENELGFGQTSGENGLKPFGRECLQRMNELGIITDVSHINETGFWEVYNLCDTIMASHSNAHGVTDHKRNLTDAQIKAIIEKDGFIGINLYPPFLGGASANDFTAHIDYILALGAHKNIGLGCDFDGIEITPDFAENVRDIRTIAAIAQSKYGKKTSYGILYNNLVTFLIDNM